ncbi:hypothetical protein [Marisediminicola sp. LYQ85]|uniref:hypothetical protein n=1 Tax=Marisediminicola sp. LYQ85 TaxID=3391062 RepID=UPI0039838879
MFEGELLGAAHRCSTTSARAGSECWGADVYARSDTWWRGMGDNERREWMSVSTS